MGLLSVIFLACALSMDAFAVSLCKGFVAKQLNLRHYLIVGAYFGGFQALMPAVGYLVGGAFASFVAQIDHYIAFGLLAFVGAKMIKGSFEHADNACEPFEFKTMLALAVATSIDALAVGVSFAFVRFEGLGVWQAIAIIGFITFCICVLGVKIGHKLGCESAFGNKLGKKAELVGGLVLVGLGVKILVEHLG